MRQLDFKPRCLRDLKKIKRREWNEEPLYEALGMLMRDGSLPPHFRPHKLSGEYAGLWECHIENDWLLVYDITDNKIIVYRTGTHSDLFT
jgi:mRNA interferase YafQ